MIKLRDIAAEYKLRSGSQKGLIINQLLISGLGELVLQGMQQQSVKVEYLAVSDMGTIKMPDDYEVYTKVGINYCGKLWLLTVNDRILPGKASNNCGTLQEASINNESFGYGFVPHINRNGENVGQLHGLGGGFNSQGYFKEDKVNRRLLLSGVSSDEVILEYISNGFSMDSVVPLHAKEALITWLDYQMVLRDPKKSLSEKTLFGRQWSSQVDRVRSFQNPFRIKEYIDIYYEDVHKGPKR